MIGLIVKIALCMGLFGVATYMLISKLDRNKVLAPGERLIYALGLAPALVSTVLFFLLWLVPGQSDTFYTIVVCGVMLIPAILLREGVNGILRELAQKLGPFFRKAFWPFEAKSFSKSGIARLWGAPTALLLVLIAIGAYTSWQALSRDVLEHDILEYASLSQWLYESKTLDYVAHRYNPETGFYYVGLHGFGFPLIITWDKIMNGLLGTSGDAFWKWLTGYYGLLIITTIWYWVRRVNNGLSTLVILLFCGSYGILILLQKFHLDTFRIWLATIFFILAARAIKSKDQRILYLLGAVGGITAFSHSIGFMLSVMAAGVLLLFWPGSMVRRIGPVLSYTALVLLFGGIHYLMDILFGTGWVFKGVNFF